MIKENWRKSSLFNFCLRKMSRGSHKESKEVTDFKEQFKKEGEHLIKDVFPKKISELDKLFHSLPLSKSKEIHSSLNIPVPDPLFFNHDATDEPIMKKRKTESLNHVDDIAGSKVLVFPKGSAPGNAYLMSLAETVKPFIQELIDHANILKMWISFLIPKIEDGNNFGVSIQEDTMAEARQVESEAASYLDQISRYFITRAKLVSKVARYPHIEDYRHSVKEVDEKQFISLRLISCELRNHYASLYDLILKNIDKIMKPRSSNAESLY